MSRRQGSMGVAGGLGARGEGPRQSRGGIGSKDRLSRDRQGATGPEAEKILDTGDTALTPEEQEQMNEMAQEEKAVLTKAQHKAAEKDTRLSEDLKAEIEMDVLDNVYSIEDFKAAGMTKEGHENYTKIKQELEVLRAERDKTLEAKNKHQSKKSGWGRFMSKLPFVKDLTTKSYDAELKSLYDGIASKADTIRRFEAKVKKATGKGY